VVLGGGAMIKNAVLVILSLAVIVVSFNFAITRYRRTKVMVEGRQLNVLVLSFCSLRRDVLGLYSPRGETLAPNINAFFRQGSYQLDNAFNPMPWTAIMHYLREEGFGPKLGRLGYDIIANDGRRRQVRIPSRTILMEETGEEVMLNGAEKNYKQDWEILRREILKRRHKPFAAVVHVKYMHYPYIDRENPEAEWDFFLDDNERATLKEYFADPAKYISKLPMLLLLSGDVDLVKHHPVIGRGYDPATPKLNLRFMGLVSNETLVREWKQSKGYQADIEIVRKIYEAGVRYMDKFVAEALNLYGDPELQEHTMVVFMGDHGETHMDREDDITHSNSLHEEALLIPALIRFPHQKGGVQKITAQTTVATFANLVDRVMKGSVNAWNAPEFFESWSRRSVVLRDCRNSLWGLRLENKYKYFRRLGDGEVFLYDLERDPLEKNNIAAKYPEIVAQLEALFWRNYPDASRSPALNCAPWPQYSK